MSNATRISKLEGKGKGIEYVLVWDLPGEVKTYNYKGKQITPAEFEELCRSCPGLKVYELGRKEQPAKGIDPFGGIDDKQH